MGEAAENVCEHGEHPASGSVERSDSFSTILDRDRIDTEDGFECRRCLRETAARDGGDVDAVDRFGDLCSECWCRIRSAFGAGIVPRGDTSGRRGPLLGNLSDVVWYEVKPHGKDIVTLEDGTRWQQSGGGWVCIRGPR